MKIHSVNVGLAQTIQVGERKMKSAFQKRSVQGAVQVKRLGLEGDEQVELAYHGGLDKAVYAYPLEHYPFWQERYQGQQSQLFDSALPFGLVGENLTLSGLLEPDVYIGDELHFPDCVLTIASPREPCSKFNAIMGYSKASKDMAIAGCCGFYLRVDKVGSLQAGQAFTLVPGARQVSVAQAFAAKFAKHRNE